MKVDGILSVLFTTYTLPIFKLIIPLKQRLFNLLIQLRLRQAAMELSAGGTATVAANTTQTFVVNCGENPYSPSIRLMAIKGTSVEVNGVMLEH